ncbi:MAG: radical SAM protein [Planctomycetota bacterium]
MKEFEFLKVETKLDGDKIIGHASGAWAEVLGPYLEQFFDKLNSLKIIAKKDGANVFNLYNPPHPTEAGMRFITRKLRMTLEKKAYPVTANLAITHRCHCKCVHCSADPFIDRTRKEVTTEEVKQVVDGALQLGASLVIFVGGEPIIHKDLPELIAHVDKSKAVVMIFTNGFMLTENKCKELADAGLFSLNISIDSPHPEQHDEWRAVPGLWQRAFDGAARAREHGILTGISTYATHESMENGDTERLLQMAVEQGFHEVTIFDCIPSGRFLKDTSKILSPAEKKRVIELGRKFHNDRSHSLGVNVMAHINSPAGEGCYGAASQFYMTAYGDINPCDFNPVSFGNIKEMPIQAIWDKMVTHPDFSAKHPSCRMQAPKYRAKYIDPLPDDPRLPVLVEDADAGYPDPSKYARKTSER